MEAHFQMPCLCHRWNKEQQHQYTNDKPAHYLDHQSHGQLTSKDVFFKSTAHTNRDTTPSPTPSPQTQPERHQHQQQSLRSGYELQTGQKTKDKKQKNGSLQLAAILSDWCWAIRVLLNVSMPSIYYKAGLHSSGYLDNTHCLGPQ